MYERKPTEEDSAQTALPLGGTGAAAYVASGDVGSGLQTEANEYGNHLASLGRTYEEDYRIAIHEAGHIVAARLLGNPLGGATVNPGPGYAGRVWGEGHEEAFAEGRGDASDVREIIAPMMPAPGESVGAVADVFAGVYNRCIEFAAGRAAERMLLGNDGRQSADDDLRQARELALLICKSEGGVESFLAHCDIAALDLLQPYGDVVMSLATALRTARTLDGTAIDKIILGVEARKALAKEHQRREDWRKAEQAAERFRSVSVTTAMP